MEYPPSHEALPPNVESIETDKDGRQYFVLKDRSVTWDLPLRSDFAVCWIIL